MANKNRILITGATGFIGNNLIPELLNKNYLVSIIARNPDKLGVNFIDKVDILKGDLVQKETIPLPAQTDTIIHSAGILGGWGIPEEKFWRINLQGTQNLLETAIKNKIRRFIYISSAGVFGPLNNGIIADENFPYQPSNIYERSKAEASKLVKMASKQINTNIVYPEFVYGPGDLHVLGLFRLINKGFFPLFDGGESLLHPTYIGDLINGIILVLEKASNGERFLITGEKPVSVKELVTTIAQVLERKLLLFNCPCALADFLVRSSELIANIFHISPPITLAQVKFFTENRSFTCDKAKNELGYVPSFSLTRGIQATIEWYKKEGYLK